ncbi:hypothetical protein ThrDRAFT_03496 [Frankia casuarinae]|uniref:Glycosyltransferase RgtA/B/C/D-like domain-containing protein n=1 Tax=Frankia casuarinae (strain DSM 45818 / CECT 9043 / HFP020203 / CcI3) TaxID=106370 RepID=Q2J7X5_FRACC|nr:MULTISPECIES: glycosyltransferase family 39 protein [Frankia]ESZ99964.1 hypothetical protein CcI6DRAFT_04624 [Frankia sp. CcI6]ABD12617.1 conserved hypothetical protein [Frankia casuarinae]EYT90848.1 hypothetical protein ThrDRAFT_03496 [Frankia casuarinae]KDA41866.1 hypothetical protein BMG523Draft_03337 [Frankia sp. BMG5.23]OAA19948.1 PMT family glycosyltransferase, 4-amino-4-deoxy-L-arabinose transferase [Frankia casuarinae]
MVVLAVGAAVVACALVHAVNLDGWPGRFNEDEGTYAAQAYALRYWGRLAHYTYWYDHPFGGWAQIAAYAWVTDAFGRGATGVSAAREFMLWVHVASCVLVYLFARRLDVRRPYAVTAVALFSLSPLALWFQRMVFLDNIMVMWLLAALVMAAAPRRRVRTAVLAGLAVSVAFWSKESALVFLPGVYLMVWINHRRRNLRAASLGFAAAAVAGPGAFVVFAAARGELHQLRRAVEFQLFTRQSSGSVLDRGSSAWNLVGFWLGLDAILLAAGLVAAIAGLLVPRLRVPSVLLVSQALLLLREGYLPYPYVVGMLPFAALCVAGLADHLHPRPGPATTTARLRLAAVASVVVAGLAVLSWQWGPVLVDATSRDDSLPSREASAWYLGHVPPGRVTITNDYAWLDLLRGGTRPIWHWKINDQAVRASLPNGWRDVDYVILDAWMAEPATLHRLPLLADALAHGVKVASFGAGPTKVTIYRVDRVVEAPGGAARAGRVGMRH